MTSMWKLIRILSSESVQNSEINFNESRTYTCGRTKNKDIVCNSGNLISKDHCIFLRDANKIFVQDLKSTNGTFMNGKKLSALELVEARNNDVISLGTSEITTEKKDVYIYRLKKEEIVIDLESELEKDIEIISESLTRIHHATEAVDDRAVLKIHLEFNVQRNNFSSFQMNPTSNLMQLTNDRRISDEIKVITQRIETGFSENTQLESSSMNLPNAQNSEQTSRKARDNRNDSGNIQENKELPSVSTTISENLFMPKNKPTIISEVALKDQRIKGIVQSENQGKNNSPARITSENQQTNMTLLKIDRECNSSKSSNATENSKSMSKESKAQNIDELHQIQTIASINDERFKSLALSRQKSNEQNKQKGEENHDQGVKKSSFSTTVNWEENKLISKFTEKKKPNKGKFEENIDRYKNQREEEQCKPVFEDAHLPIGPCIEENNNSDSKFIHNMYKNQREEVQRKWKKSSFAPGNPMKNVPNKENNMSGSKFKPVLDENPFTIGSSRDPERENVQSDANPFRIEYYEEEKRIQREDVQKKWKKSSFTPVPSKNPLSIVPNKEKIYKSWSQFELNEKQSCYKIRDNKDASRRLSLLPTLQNNKLWKKSLLSVLLQDKEPSRSKILESENPGHKFRKNEPEKTCDSSSSSESSKHRFSDKKEPGRKENNLRSAYEEKNDENKTHEAKRDKGLNREKTIPVAVENTQKNPILQKIEIEKNSKMFKENILKKLSQREEDTVSRDNNTLVQILKTLDMINDYINNINEDHKESLEEKSSSLTSISDSTSISSFEIKNQKSNKLKNCREPEKVSSNDEPTIKKSRIEKGIKRLVDYESSSTEDDMEDNNRVTFIVSPISVLKLYETDLKSDEFLIDLLSWSPVDFLTKDYSDCKACLENYYKFSNLSSKTYKDHESYSRTLLSFLLLEIACGIKREFSTLEKNPFFTKSVVLEDSAAEFFLTERNSYLLSFKIRFTCSESNISQVPLVGDLLSIELIHGNNQSFKMIFAYVSEVSIDAIGDPTLIMEDEDFQLSVTCTVVSKLLEFNIYKSRIKSLRVIVGVLVALNLVEALEKLKKSALLPMILHPNPETFSLSVNSSNKSGVLRSFRYPELQENLNYDQLNAVMKITNVIQGEEPKICLIEGPPGTGKTNIATNIILRILSMQTDLEGQNQPMKILVCAKSKSEIDEILIRLSTEEKRLGMYHKLVRVGNPDNVPERIKSFTLRELAVSYTDVKKEDSELDPLNYWENFDFVEKCILSNANVIFCTLSMCLSERMSSTFGEDNPIPICIVDEATQANEIDILQPLSFGVKQLILLGDGYKCSLKNLFLEEKFNKMPYVAENLRLTNSLFSRLIANFEESKESPVINLEAQFRMNKRVTFLINQFFHKETLEDKQLEQKEFPIYSCLIFSLQSSNIPTFAGNLIFCILNFTGRDDFEGFEKPISIGVIVAQSSLKKLVETEIEQRISTISMEKREQFTIDVDTIGGFKNQERHILIMTCINENSCLLLPSGEQWLYTAMTKVKYSLIMYGDKHTFENTEKVCLWNLFIKYLKDKKNLLNIQDPADPKELLKKLLSRKITQM